MGIRRINLIEMSEIINKLEGFNPNVADEHPYATQLDYFKYLWVYVNTGNIYLLNKELTGLITKEEALEVIRPYLRKYKLKIINKT